MFARFMMVAWLTVAASLAWTAAAALYLRDDTPRPAVAVVLMLLCAAPLLLRFPRLSARLLAAIVGGGLLLRALAPGFAARNLPTGSEGLWSTNGSAFGSVTWTLAGSLLFCIVLVAMAPGSSFETHRPRTTSGSIRA